MKRLALCFLTACSSSAAPAQEPPPQAEVIYVGATTDEALTRLLALPAKDVSAQHVVIDSPSAGAVLPASEPVAFSFQPAAAALGGPARRPSKEPRSHEATRSAARNFLAWLNPVGVAHAHGAPFNGVGYYLVLSDATRRQALRVFTDRRFYTVELPAATTLRDAKQPLTLTITSAVFEENEVAESGGPFLAGSVEFRVE